MSSFTYNIDIKNSPDVHFTFDNTDHAWMNCSNCLSNWDINDRKKSITETYLTLTQDYRLTCKLCNNKSRVPIFTRRWNNNMKYCQTDRICIDNRDFTMHWFRDGIFVFLLCDKCRESLKIRPYNDMHISGNDRKIILEVNCKCKRSSKWCRYRSLMHSEESFVPYEWQQIGM